MEHTCDEIAAAITFGQPLSSKRGMRRRTRVELGGYDFESQERALAREVEFVRASHLQSDWLWGREQWMTQRCNSLDLIAWTTDRCGRIVRGWRRTRRDRQIGGECAYHPAGYSCPIEAAWLPSVMPGEFSFPAFPFLHLLQGGKDAAARATVDALWAMRPLMPKFW